MSSPLPTHGLLIAVSCMILTACAMKVAPSGGPPDTTPASVTRTEPISGTINFTDETVTLYFDDYVDRSIRNSITIQPNTRFNTSYAGNSIDITFAEPLKENTTYSITIGTDWRDLNGNSPSEATSIIFSTGPDIDTGSISGIVRGGQLTNVEVFIYPGADTLDANFNPAQTFPAYHMPVGTSGSFKVGGLGDGTYRVIAVQEQNANGLLDANERYAMASRDVVIAESKPVAVKLLLGPSLADMMKDTVSTPKIDSIAADSLATDTTQKERVDPGSISGTFLDTIQVKGPYLVRFIDRTGAVAKVVRVQSGESWNVPEIPPGTYIVDVVIDVDTNDRYDHGRSTPFAFAESWYPLDITVNVRQRWTTEGIRILLK